MARETPRSCAWYGEEDVCRSNYSIPAVVLSNSNNRFAEYIANLFVSFAPVLVAREERFLDLFLIDKQGVVR